MCLTTSIARACRLIVCLRSYRTRHLIARIRNGRTIGVRAYLLFIRGLQLSANVLRLVLRLSSFRRGVSPLLIVRKRRATLLILLDGNRVNRTIHVFSSIRVTRMKFKGRLVSLTALVLRLFSNGSILLIRNVTFARDLYSDDGRINRLVVTICVNEVLLREILRSRGNEVFSDLNVRRASAIHIFRKRMSILGSFLPLTADAGNVSQCNRTSAYDCRGWSCV